MHYTSPSIIHYSQFSLHILFTHRSVHLHGRGEHQKIDLNIFERRAIECITVVRGKGRPGNEYLPGWCEKWMVFLRLLWLEKRMDRGKKRDKTYREVRKSSYRQRSYSLAHLEEEDLLGYLPHHRNEFWLLPPFSPWCHIGLEGETLQHLDSLFAKQHASPRQSLGGASLCHGYLRYRVLALMKVARRRRKTEEGKEPIQESWSCLGQHWSIVCCTGGLVKVTVESDKRDLPDLICSRGRHYLPDTSWWSLDTSSHGVLRQRMLMNLWGRVCDGHHTHETSECRPSKLSSPKHA